MADQILTGLDIGSSHVRVVVAKVVQKEGGLSGLQVLGAVSSPSAGIHRGAVTSMEEAVSAVTRALEKAERLSGVPINSAWVGIAGQGIMVQESHGAIAVSRPNEEITDDDVERVIEAAKTLAMPANYDIVTTFPRAFAVDGQRGVRDPLGMTGIKLEVDAVIIEALNSHYKNLTKCVYRTSLDIDEMVYSPLAVAETVASDRQKQLGVAVVTIGAATTSVAIFEEGVLLHTAVLPFGGDHITSDIAIGLRTSLDVAEQVKLSLGQAVPDAVDRSSRFSLRDFGVELDEEQKTRFVAEIIEARTEEIFEAVDAELRACDRSGMLPVGAVLTGGGAKLPGIVEVGKRVLRLPCTVGVATEVETVVDEALDPAFSTAVGLVSWGAHVAQARGGASLFGRFMPKVKMGGVAEALRKWMKSLIP
jgi:cell division protein FtsA